MKSPFALAPLLLFALGPLLLQCRREPWECPAEKREREECELVRTGALLSSLLRPSGGSAATPQTESQCAATPANAESLVYLRTGSVPSLSSCYYRFEIAYEPGNEGPFQPDFRLIPETGNSDLYIGFDNDATGGTVGYTACTSSASGGGWVRCGRNAGSAEEFLTTNAEGVPALSPGAYRIVAVYNPGASSSRFALLAYKNGSE